MNEKPDDKAPAFYALLHTMESFLAEYMEAATASRTCEPGDPNRDEYREAMKGAQDALHHLFQAVEVQVRR